MGALWVAFAGLLLQQGMLRAPGGGDLLRQQVDPATTGKLAQPSAPADTTGTLRSSDRVARQPAPPPTPIVETPLAGADATPPTDAEMDLRLNELRVCRFDVARQHHLAASRVRVGEVELRWTVLPDGSVEQPEVVAVRATDPDVMSCMSRKMSEWRFAPRLPSSPAPRSIERLSLH